MPDRPLFRIAAGATAALFVCMAVSAGTVFDDPEHLGASGLREVDIPGSPALVRLWEQRDVNGAAVPHYAISLDGKHYARPRATSYELKLRRFEHDPLEVGVVELVDARFEAAADTSLFIVQFITQPLPEYRAAIADLGGEVHAYLPRHSHIVRLDADAIDAVANLPFVRWVGPFHPAYRVENAVLDRFVGADAKSVPVGRYNVMVFEPMMKEIVAERITGLGGFVDRANAGKSLLEATLNGAQLAMVARFDEVLFIDLWSAPEKDMDNARAISGANYIETVAGFTGQGVRGEVLDAGFNVSHVDFSASPLIQHTAVGVDSHGAATSGIVFGDGTGDAAGRGMMPDAQGIIADASVVFTGPARYDHTGELVQDPYFAVFQTASVGSTRTLNYTTISADTDAMLFDFDIAHCQSQSNAGDRMSRPQAWAKNIISGGGVRHQNTLTKADDCWDCGPTTASIGPATDGRIKPDLCHFFDETFTTTTGSPTAYTATFGGTSGATPIICGHVGLFFQMWAEGTFGDPAVPGGTVFENRCHMTTAKAMLINTASQYPFSGAAHDLTRVHQGWGMPDLQNLYDLRNKMIIVDEEHVLPNLGVNQYTAIVDIGEPALRATLVYADPPGNPAATLHRINDLTLKVTSPGGVVYWGNNGLLEGNWSTPGGAANEVDTVENVFIENPEPGEWFIEVSVDELIQDSHVQTPQDDADYALVVSGVEEILPALFIQVPGGVPADVLPATPTQIDVTIAAGAEAIVPGSELLFYRTSPGDAFMTAPLSPVGGDAYIATLPGFDCDDQPEFYVSAEGDGGTVRTSPLNAPTGLYSMAVGETVLTFNDDLETDNGWLVENQALAGGGWERGIPAGAGDRGDPTSDYDGSGQCFLTGNAPGNSDVDGGPTILTTPVFDATGLADPTISYARWLNSSNANDTMDVYISENDGASWKSLESASTSSGWQLASFRLADVGAVPTALMRLQFTVADNPNDSITEAGIDALIVSSFECDGGVLLGDITGPGDAPDGVVDALDFLLLISQWGTPCVGACEGDITGPAGVPDGNVDALDFLALIGNWS